MAHTLFISPAQIKKQSQVNFNIEDKIIIPVIALEQDTNFEQTLGTTFYRSLQLQVSGGTLTTLNRELIENYIQPSLMYFVLAGLVESNNFKLNSKGVGQMESENEKPLDDDQLIYRAKEFRNNGQYYNNLLMNYLKENYTLFQDYATPGSGWDIILPKKDMRFFGGMYFPTCPESSFPEYIPKPNISSNNSDLYYNFYNN